MKAPEKLPVLIGKEPLEEGELVSVWLTSGTNYQAVYRVLGYNVALLRVLKVGQWGPKSTPQGNWILQKDEHPQEITFPWVSVMQVRVSMGEEEKELFQK